MPKKNETPEEREKRLAYHRKWNHENRVEEGKKRRQRYLAYQQDPQISEYRLQRLEVLNRMGGECVFCEEDDEPILVIDHVNNDGHIERKISRNIFSKLDKMFEIPSSYRILCIDCNHKRRIFEPIYGPDPRNWPHMTVDEAYAKEKADEALAKERIGSNGKTA